MAKWQVQDMVDHMEIGLDTKQLRYVIFFILLKFTIVCIHTLPKCCALNEP